VVIEYDSHEVKEREPVKAKKLCAFALVAVLALGTMGLAGCGGADEPAEEPEAPSEEPAEETVSGSITVGGSDTMVNLGQALAEEFMNAYDQVDISVTGGGSGTGIAALINGTIDFANASRAIKGEEIEEAEATNGVEPTEYVVAYDGIAVVVNPDLGVEELTFEQVGAIYRGEITNWSEVGGPNKDIVLLSRDTSSGTYAFFLEFVVQADDGRPCSAPTRACCPQRRRSSMRPSPTTRRSATSVWATSFRRSVSSRSTACRRALQAYRTAAIASRVRSSCTPLSSPRTRLRSSSSGS
jgi:ABC-type phosphate transport system substrate-binding protein